MKNKLEHLIGVCGDAHTHLDLLDVAIVGVSVGIVALAYWGYRARRKHMSRG